MIWYSQIAIKRGKQMKKRVKKLTTPWHFDQQRPCCRREHRVHLFIDMSTSDFVGVKICPVMGLNGHNDIIYIYIYVCVCVCIYIYICANDHACTMCVCVRLECYYHCHCYYECVMLLPLSSIIIATIILMNLSIYTHIYIYIYSIHFIYSQRSMAGRPDLVGPWGSWSVGLPLGQKNPSWRHMFWTKMEKDRGHLAIHIDLPWSNEMCVWNRVNHHHLSGFKWRFE